MQEDASLQRSRNLRQTRKNPPARSTTLHLWLSCCVVACSFAIVTRFSDQVCDPFLAPRLTHGAICCNQSCHLCLSSLSLLLLVKASKQASIDISLSLFRTLENWAKEELWFLSLNIIHIYPRIQHWSYLLRGVSLQKSNLPPFWSLRFKRRTRSTQKVGFWSFAFSHSSCFWTTNRTGSSSWLTPTSIVVAASIDCLFVVEKHYTSDELQSTFPPLVLLFGCTRN